MYKNPKDVGSPLKYHIDLLGVKKPHDFFLLNISPHYGRLHAPSFVFLNYIMLLFFLFFVNRYPCEELENSDCSPH